MKSMSSGLWSFIAKLGFVMGILALAIVATTSKGIASNPSGATGNSEDAFIQVYGYSDEYSTSGPFTVTVHYDNGCDYTYVITGNNVSDPPPDEGGDFIPGTEGCGNVSSVTITQGNGESLTLDRDSQGRGIEICMRLWFFPPVCYCVSLNFYSGRIYIRTYFKLC